MPKLFTDYPLDSHNTLGLKVQARYAQCIQSEADLLSACADTRTAQCARLVLGSGSNVLFLPDVFEGVVWHMACMGRRLIDEDAHYRFIEVGAGENWAALVEWTLDQGWPGLENLALIPGTVGAAPIQNIGAYGVEISAYLMQVRALELAHREWVALDAATCALGYRDSFFKRAGRDRFVITALTLRLPKAWTPSGQYAALSEELKRRKIDEPGPRDIFDAVVAVRRAKLPDPAVQGNVGSFFKNPIVHKATFDALRTTYPDMAAYSQPNGDVKLAAAWLIDQCGWRGRREGPVGVHAQQALVLIQHGGARGADIWQLAQRIQHDVQQRFGVYLEPEPCIVR